MTPTKLRKLLIIRHAIAFERDARRWPNDAERPLTHVGRRRFRCVARELAKFLDKPDQLLTSSLKRARQTARILEEAAYPRAERVEELNPGAATDSVIAMLAARSASCIAVVGHEPALSTLISALLAGAGPTVRSRLKKGGIAVLQFEGDIASGKGELLMLIPPRLLHK